MALISVIVPVYNVENYIDRCMQSLVNQTIGIENLEIVLVNDASTDNSLDKLLEWEKKYPESILVITYEENLKQGGARNVGLKYATSDYVGFVDSDDWVEPDMYETLYNYTDNQHYDEVRGKYVDNVNNQDIYRHNGIREDQVYNFQKLEEGYYFEKIDNQGNVGEYGSVCCAIYKRSIIIENEIWFPEHIVYEDNCWGIILSFYISNMYIVDKVIYHYFLRSDSTFHVKNSLSHLGRLDSEIAILNAYKQRGLFDKFKDELEYSFISRFYIDTLFILFSRCDVLSDEFEDKFEYMKQKVHELFPNYMENEKIKKEPEPFSSLLRLLEIPYKIPIAGLNDVKTAYCDVLNEANNIYQNVINGVYD